METIIEKTTVRINTKPVKDLIKSYVEKQKFYKKSRKTATFSIIDGKIIWDPMHPSIAQSNAYWNGLELRIFYAAYGLLRGKKLSQVEQNYTEDNCEHFLNTHKGKIEKTLEGFKQMSQTKEE
jgi:hypothetical protein